MGLRKSRGKHARGGKDAQYTEVIGNAAEAEAEGGAMPAAADSRADGASVAEAEGAAAGAGQGPEDASEPATDATQALSGAEAQSLADGATQALPNGATQALSGAAPRAVPGEDEVAQGEAAALEPIGDDVIGALFGEIPQKKRHAGLKAFGITVGVLAAVVLVAYIAGAVVFMGRFLPNTVLGDHDISLKTDAEVEGILDDVRAGYRLDVVGDGFSYRATGADLGVSIDSAGIVAALHDDLNAWAWPALIFQPLHDETDQLVVAFDVAACEEGLRAAVASFNETATPPTNASILYDDKTDRFVVTPEQIGTQLDEASVLAGATSAISALQPKLTLTQADLVQPTVLSSDEKLIASAELATGLASAELTLNMGGKVVGEVDGDTLSTFIAIDDNLDVTFREDALNGWVDELARGFNTIDTERSYTRADGKQITVAGGVYGWEIDSEALKGSVLDGIRTGAKTQIEIPCLETAAIYDGVGQRDWGNRYIDVDLAEQHVRFYGDDGAIIWEAPCISGSPDGVHNTVTGVWTVNARQSPSKLIGYENGKKIYETTVTYWMPFEGNSIGFHDATWQPSFGGSMYANGYGSHGCVNLSYSAAQSLYDIIEEGDVVVVHH